MNRPKPKPKPKAPPKTAAPLSRRKLWWFRLMALVVVPLLFVGLLEAGLRLAGFGYPTTFLVKSTNHGEKTFVQNNRFGWRFFGPRAARLPDAISVPVEKPAGTIRVFIFGESAAYGDPQPRFGLPRMLNALLDLRHPGQKFEVVNTAMTGINSHVILPQARDCAGAGGDVWVIYMGNNEVVGPFGAGTVFGSQTLPLPLIRGGLALKATRIGQAFDALRRVTQKSAATSGEWEGMRMFVPYKLAGADPRLGVVDDNFRHNLKDIIAAGQSGGAKIVLSTVGVNLKECAPFASLHRPDVAAASLVEWQRDFDAGVRSQADGDYREAATDFDEARKIDDQFAELRFRRGQCALALQDPATAQAELAAARDLDALRFRCDSRLNDIIRQQAADGVALADGEKALAAASPDGIPGPEFFYEHVHLTFEGNYVLARAIAEKVESAMRLPAGAAWPDPAQCAERLGHTPRDTQLALSEIFGRLKDEPFTFQANHDEQMDRLAGAVRALPAASSPAALGPALTAAETALARWPEDAGLWEQMGEIKQAQSDYAGAATAAQHAVDLVPSNEQGWLLYGILLAQEAKYEEATTAFKTVITLDPQAVWGRQNLGLCLEKLGRCDEAITEFKRALVLKPAYGTAWLALGQTYEAMGRTNDAGQCYTAALANPVNQADDMAALARFCATRKWYGAAVTNYAAAIELSPADPELHLEAGQVLVGMGQHIEAAQHFQAAVQLAPDLPQTHMQLAVELGRLGKAAMAEPEFREVLRLDPNFTQAQVDLGVALFEQGKLEDARQQFEAALQRIPGDPTALRFLQQIRQPAIPPANH